MFEPGNNRRHVVYGPPRRGIINSCKRERYLFLIDSDATAGNGTILKNFNYICSDEKNDIILNTYIVTPKAVL